MAGYRRVRVAGGCYFFTVVLLNRRSELLVKHIALLRKAVKMVKVRRPFHIDAWVVLPDHLHCLWTLPEGDADYSSRWRDIKKAFSKGLPRTEAIPDAWSRRGERGIWQRRFWEHTIRGDDDFARHFDYIHLNPYKHGLVKHVRDWPYSTFHQCVKAGIYREDWLTEVIDLEGGERRR